MKRTSIIILVGLLLVNSIGLMHNTQLAKADWHGTVYIRSDGSVDPPTAPIQRSGDVYVLTENIVSEGNGIVVERSDIILDGNGFTVRGPGVKVGPFGSIGIYPLAGNVEIKNTRVTGFNYGIFVSGFDQGSSTNLRDNNVIGNGLGISLFYTSGSILRGNSMGDNLCNLYVYGKSLLQFTNDVDDSNTVNGKPVIYWIGQADRTVPSNAGYVVLTSCSRITVQGLILENNGDGITMAGTTESVISRNIITRNGEWVGCGILFCLSSNHNTLFQNAINANFGVAIYVDSSSYNTLTKNTISANGGEGICLDVGSNHNWIVENTISANEGAGIYVDQSPDNYVFHNNFIDNNPQVSNREDVPQPAVNVWDDGYPSGGNYWNDYSGIDKYKGPNQDQLGSDGIGDIPYTIDDINLDHYPLMKPWSEANDLILQSFSPVQVVYASSVLVADKPTAFRAVVQNSFSKNQPLRIRFIYNGGSPTDYLTTIAPNSVQDVLIPFGSYILPQAGTITYSAEIDPGNKIDETNEYNNKITGNKKVVTTDDFSIVYAPMCVLGEDPVSRGNLNNDQTNGDLFFKANYPTSLVDSGVGSVDVTLLHADLFFLWAALSGIDAGRALSHRDKAVAIVPHNYGDTTWLHHYFPDVFDRPTPGVHFASWPWPWNTVIVEDGYWPAIPHEIGHTYGLRPTTAEEEYNANYPGNDATGYFVERGVPIVDALCFMGVSAYQGLPDALLSWTENTVQYRYDDGYWICSECYNNLIEQLKIGEDPETIHMSGVVFENGTVRLNPWYRIPDGTPDLPLGLTGNCTIVYLDGSDAVIGTTGFDLSFFLEDVQLDVTGFSFAAEFPPQTRRIQILNESTVIVSKTVSPNPPSASLISLNGGESLVPGTDCVISWTGSDADDDTLYYSLLYSPDNGVTWNPIKTNLNETSYVWRMDDLMPGSNYLVRVIATDGVNTGEDISDSVFAVADVVPPTIVLLSPLNKTYYANRVPFIVEFDEATSWIGYSIDNEQNVTASDSTLIDVDDGYHRIVVYANDTSGNMASSETMHFEVNSSARDPWKSDFIGVDGYPVVSSAVCNGKLYAASNNNLYEYETSGWRIIRAPTYITSLLSLKNTLVIGGAGGLYTYDGEAFKLILPVSTYIKTLGIYNATLYAGTLLDNPPTLYSCNGLADNSSDWDLDTGFWSIQSFSGPFGSIDSLAEYDGALYVASGGTIYSSNGTNWDIANTFDDVYAFSSMTVYNGRLYLATRDQGWRKPKYLGGSGFSGRVIEFDGENWTNTLDHDYWVYSLGVYNGKLYAGTANKILTYDGLVWETSFNATEGAYYALCFENYDSKVHVGMGNGYVFADPIYETVNLPDLPPTITVPEFPSNAILMSLMISSLPAIALVKRRPRRKPCTTPNRD